MTPTCCVSFRSPDGREWTHVTAASTLFEAARTAYAWFHDPFWQGPRPDLDTVFSVLISARNQTWRVRPRRAFEALRTA